MGKQALYLEELMQYIGLPKLKIHSCLDTLQTTESPRVILYLWQMIQRYIRRSHVRMSYVSLSIQPLAGQLSTEHGYYRQC